MSIERSDEARRLDKLYERLSSVDKRIAELEAENKKLIEGQQAKLEAGS